jgi:hypothetical protein
LSVLEFLIENSEVFGAGIVIFLLSLLVQCWD